MADLGGGSRCFETGAEWLAVDGCQRCECTSDGATDCALPVGWISGACARLFASEFQIENGDVVFDTTLAESTAPRLFALDAAGAVIGEVGVDRWSIDDVTIAQLREDVVWPVDNGTTVLRAWVGDVVTTAPIEVAVPMRVSLPEGVLFTALGDTQTLQSQIEDPLGNPFPSEGQRVPTWTVADSDVARIQGDATGHDVVLQAERIGTTTVTADLGDGVLSVSEVSVDPWTSVAVGDRETCGILDSGLTYCWGAMPTAPLRSADGAILRLSKIAMGNLHSCGIDRGGTAWCWGSNSWGQLGTGNRVDSIAPRQVAGAPAFVDIALPTAFKVQPHTCALSASGEAWCWGYGSAGQLGVGTEVDTLLDGGSALAPIAAATDVRFDDLAAIDGVTCALDDSAGRLWCWGAGTFSPQASSFMGSLRSIDGQFTHWCAVDAADDAWCWGTSETDALGTGTSSETDPTLVVPQYAWAQIATGRNHSCGIRKDQTLMCWGPSGNPPYLGRGTGASPWLEGPQTTALASTRFSQVSAGGRTSCAITPSGALFCWGFAATGDGTVQDRYEPTRVLTPTEW